MRLGLQPSSVPATLGSKVASVGHRHARAGGGRPELGQERLVRLVEVLTVQRDLGLVDCDKLRSPPPLPPLRDAGLLGMR